MERVESKSEPNKRQEAAVDRQSEPPTEPKTEPSGGRPKRKTATEATAMLHILLRPAKRIKTEGKATAKKPTVKKATEKKAKATSKAKAATKKTASHTSDRLHLHSTTTPPQSSMHEPPIITEPTSFAKQEKAQRLESKSNKVNTAGSPLPKAQAIVNNKSPVDVHKASEDKAAQVQSLKDGEDDIVYPDIIPHFTSSLKDLGAGDIVSINGKKYRLQEVSDENDEVRIVNKVGNGKRVPNPPNALSNVELSPHHEYLVSGELINSKTSERITPAQPSQNPFITQGATNVSSFMKTLRKEAHREPEGVEDGSDEANKSRTRKRKRVEDIDEEAEKLLVEQSGKRRRPRARFDPIQKSSLPSTSTSQETSATIDKTEKESSLTSKPTSRENPAAIEQSEKPSGDNPATTEKSEKPSEDKPATIEQSENPSQETPQDEAEFISDVLKSAEAEDPNKGAVYNLLCVAALGVAQNLGKKEASLLKPPSRFEKAGGGFLSRYAMERNAMAKDNKRQLDLTISTLKTVYEDAVKGRDH